MFKYRLIGDNDYIFDVKGTIAKNRGITDIDEYLNLDHSVEIPWRKLINVEKAINCIGRHIEEKSKIYIVIDADTDGYTSGSIIYQYIKLQDNEIDIQWHVHKEKKHGIKDVVIPEDVDLVIIPDSSSDEHDIHKELSERGIEVVVIDHHEIELGESPYAIVVNPQLGGGNNLSLSAAGVVYKVCKGLDVYFWTNYADYFLDLVALGNIADSMSMKEKETRYYVNRGLNEINNDFFRALIKQQEYSLNGKINPTSVGFYISPLINAVTRIGSLQDRIDMFKAFIGTKERVPYKPRGSDEILVPLVDDMARRCYNAKNKQNRMRDKIAVEIVEKVTNEELYKNKVIIVHGIEMENGLTGLIANHISSKFKRPSLILSGKNEKGNLKGSARGYDQSGFKELKDIVLQTGLFEMAKGHSSAFGLEIKEENIQAANKALNELLKDVSFEDIYEIDFEIPYTSLNKSILKEICELEGLWGKGLEETLILVKNIEIDKVELHLIGKKEDTISIKHNEIEFIMFRQSSDIFQQMQNAETIELVGKAKVNEYKGNVNYQIYIDDFNILN
ncbi:DHH family phosphoesterase [Heyndrickxia camelliae]|uniref:Single-stranded-DNA-specific exonuclease RecJ n=1 Tax=Heyndrickxia camelliae TaxID=1707093 RepID=A0A2N3LFX7_9BACI|nr:DHH family phosphoesterase [Heyndrickxia camelliae]PKR83526.1 single-stranded-DNA-specific exonuclease RecJ [Heyndrickxia camelliae]